MKTIINKYEQYVNRIKGTQETVENKIVLENYIDREELMLRGNNRRSIYKLESVRVGNNDRKRRHGNYGR
ncbi:hypothetical protein [Clostridium sp.]|uniref:hypothetical protein n=1 Tax=Clostridium sp. TaxID=1506 RepID=UPI00263509E1|nr:hypothetical protein [Clostridium sp.]